MNREIKFRGKCTYSGHWVFGDLWQSRGRIDIVDKYSCVYPIGPETVGQYTGLKDRNEKDIYEGDIVQIQGHPFEGPMQINGNYEVGYNDRMELCCGSLLLHREIHYATVIGNKFENPSLLEVTHE